MKVNLHITEFCNYRCKQCFAKFNSISNLDISKWKYIVSNCIESGVEEFNIAGGEPFVYPWLNELIDYIYDCGIRTDIITNASRLTKEWVLSYGRKINTLGISIDSIVDKTNILIGRCTTDGTLLDYEYLTECLHLLREINPTCKIKVNTVVSKLNYTETLHDFVKRLNCDRWKVLRMHVLTDNGVDNSYLSVTDEEYELFARNNIPEYNERHYDTSINHTIKCEDGLTVVLENDMEAAYLIIDARGFLIDNKDNKYTDVIDCTKQSFEEGLNNLILNDDAFYSRYDI